MSAGKRKWRMRWWMWPIVAFLVMRYGTLLLPGVRVYYSEDATAAIGYLWVDGGSSYDSSIGPGGYTTETVDIVRDADHRVEFFWWRLGKGREHCVSVTPKWPHTTIYLDANADIDYSKGTDADRLQRCPNMTANM